MSQGKQSKNVADVVTDKSDENYYLSILVRCQTSKIAFEQFETAENIC